MKEVDLGQTISILANIGVIAGIVFLAFELRQNTLATELIASGSASSYIRDLNNMITDNESVAELLVKARAKESLTDAENVRLDVLNASMYIGWHAIHEQYESGLLSEDQWMVHREGMRIVLHDFPFTQDSWERQSYMYSDQFNELIERLIREPRAAE